MKVCKIYSISLSRVKLTLSKSEFVSIKPEQSSHTIIVFTDQSDMWWTDINIVIRLVEYQSVKMSYIAIQN